MEHLTPLIIAVIAGACLASFAWWCVFGPQGLMKRRLKDKVRELEVRVRMGTGMAIVEDLRAIARLYMSAADLYTADQYYVKAVKAMEQQFGLANPELAELLKEHVKLMERMKRTRDAAKVKQRIDELSQRKQG